MERQEAYPITYGVLGLLVVGGPMSGYDLKQAFDCTLGPLWNAAHSQIYNELRCMLELGWVEMERQEQDTRPDKKVYTATQAGRTALGAWQVQQPSGGLQMRDEVLLRFAFGSYGDPRGVAATLRAAIADHEERLALYRRTAQLLPPDPATIRPGEPINMPYTPDPFFVELAHFAERFEQTYLTWLREALEFVEARAAQVT